jgi:hypothetical protein
VTPEEIGAEAINRLARMQFEHDEPSPGDRYEDWAPQYRREATKFVDALGDMLPTAIEWGYVCGECDVEQPGVPCVRSTDEVAIRKMHSGLPILRRYHHDWQEVTE